ncbi:asparagine synthetase B family protein [Aliiruegeria lutimaris]|uniref:asparagine synthase (glutamine-hydrolyzing) n=1 Tax=Aliiruegeria lutimaris TaxID=571298 RepID=A0A1G9DTL1_9RHOB|nr:asparagine synthase-related protein [Aliiruegeria lutimaris]SDK67192.1 asparagine synthase (glutamine-hydrolysing) [Aliiruegeria lutimaris]
MDLIFGILHLDGRPVDDGVLNRMADGLPVAPDIERSLDLHCQGPLGMGRLTLGRRSLRRELTQEAGLHCVADARLYTAPGADSPKDLSPEERERLLCRLHARYGDDAARPIDGDFAYAIWNEKSQRLSLIRDHVGVRPLFYVHEAGKFLLWASHSTLILHSRLISEEFDLGTAVANFVYDASDVEGTLVKGLKRLPAAHAMHVTASGDVTMRRYWELKCKDPIPESASFEECAQTLKRYLSEAVLRRLPKREVIGAHLSGGLDSTAISVLAARALQQDGRPLHTYSFVSRTRPDVHLLDERPYSDATVQGEPNIYNTKIAPPEDFADHIGALRDRMAVYFGAEERILDAAERDTVDVILSGWGGDEVVSFAGQGAYGELFLRGRWRQLLQEIHARSERTGARKTSILANEVAETLVPPRLWNTLRRVAGKKDVPETVDEKLIKMLQPAFRKTTKRATRPGANTRKNRLNRFNDGFVAYRLENWAMQGAARGIQYTFPMLDRHLLEYAIRLPAGFLRKDGLGRAIFREAIRDLVPESVRTLRQKQTPFPCNLLRLAEQRDDYLGELQQMRRDPRLTRVVDFDAVEQTLRQVPDVDEVKAAFNAEASGGSSPSMELVFADEPLIFLRFLKMRLDS